MAGRNNYEPGQGPPPLGGIYSIPIEGEIKQAGVKYPYVAYSEEVTEAICDRLAMGNSLTQIETLVGMPSRRAIRMWRDQYPEFDDKIQVATEMGCDVIMDEIRAIADTPLVGETIESGPKGVTIKTGDNVERSKLMIYGRTYQLGKISRKYGDKQKVEMTGKDGEELKPFTVVISSVLDRDKKETA